MSYAAVENGTRTATAEVHIPAEINWEMLDKSKFFLVGAALFSGVSGFLYPIVLVKTRLQVSHSPLSSLRTASSILRHEGLRGFYRGFATSLTGTIPARALYMSALEITKSSTATAALRLGVPDPAAAAISNAAAGLSASMAAQLVWTPVDVVSQRLMVRDSAGRQSGVEACRKILASNGIKGLYRGFGVSILSYAPSNAVWWATYSVSQKALLGTIAERSGKEVGCGTVVGVQGVSAGIAGGMAAVVTMPLDTIKTRMQVLDGKEWKGVVRTVGGLVREGGWRACYRGLGPRWASMSMSAMTMITTYEFVKRLSAKEGCCSGL